MKNLEIGKIVNTHGLRGELKVMPWCDDPMQLAELEYVVIDDREYDVEKARMHKNMMIMKLDGIDDINDAELYRNKVLTVPRELLGELPDGVYYICDLLGCKVETDSGEILGSISDVIKTGSNDVYSVKNSDGKELLIPVIDEVVKMVDIEARRVVITPIKGLID